MGRRKGIQNELQRWLMATAGELGIDLRAKQAKEMARGLINTFDIRYLDPDSGASSSRRRAGKKSK